MASQHMDFYMKEYGLDSTFEYYLSRVWPASSKTGRPERAEPGLPITTAPWSDPFAIDHEDDGTAKLRLALVHPEFRAWDSADASWTKSWSSAG